jgi:hypothetical protein
MHTLNDRTPYTYLIGWSAMDKFYFGCRYAKNCNPSELFISYFTSSKHVKNFISIHGIPDIIQIRKTFNNIDECRKAEHIILRRLKVICDDRWLNKTDNISISSDAAYSGATSVNRKSRKGIPNPGVSKGRKGIPSWNKGLKGDERCLMAAKKTANKRFENGTYVSWCKGLKLSEEQTKNMRGKTRTPEHSKKISDAKKGKIAWNKGLKLTESEKEKLRKPKNLIMKECPYCHLVGRGSNMTRYHFNNCKAKT